MATLFSKAKGGPAERKTLNDLLKFIVDNTRSAANGALVPKTMLEKIEKLEPGLVQARAGATVDPAGSIVVQATPKAIEALYGAEAAAAAPKQSLFVVQKGFAVPPSKRGGVKEDVYPFAQMEPGDSFFVPATDERPNPAKALASTVSSATKRYAAVYPEGHERAGQPTGKDGRTFTVRNRVAGEDGETANGARVYRVK